MLVVSSLSLCPSAKASSSRLTIINCSVRCEDPFTPFLLLFNSLLTTLQISIRPLPLLPVAHTGRAALHLATFAAAATVAEACIVLYALADDLRCVDVDYLKGGFDV